MKGWRRGKLRENFEENSVKYIGKTFILFQHIGAWRCGFGDYYAPLLHSEQREFL
jgi:hypothetical protein